MCEGVGLVGGFFFAAVGLVGGVCEAVGLVTGFFIELVGLVGGN